MTKNNTTLFLIAGVALVVLWGSKAAGIPMGSSGIPTGGANTVYGPGTNPVVNILTNTSFDKFLTDLSHDIFN